MDASTVGMPVPRPPPCRPGRAVVPHPVPRWSALPRCTAQPSGTHAPTWNVRQTRTRALDAVADAGPLLPRVTPPLASPPVAPWERPVHRPMEDAGERAGVPAHARVVVVAPAARRQTREACPPRPLPGWWDPCRASLASGGERRAGGAPPDARHAVPLWWPAPRAAQPGAAPRRAGVPTAAPAQRGVRWCHVAVAGRPPVGPPPPPPCGVLRHAAGPPPVRSLAAPPGGSPTAWWHPVGPPEVQGLGPSDLGEDGRDRPALGPARLGMDALARGVHHPGLQPWAPPVEHGPVVAAPAHPVHAPWRVPRRAAAWARGLSQGALASVWAGAGAGADRLQRPPSGARAVTTLQHVRRVDGRAPRRAGQWPPWVCQGGAASGPGRAVGVRQVPASDHRGPGARWRPPRPQGLAGAVPVGGRGVCRPLVSPTGPFLRAVGPAVTHARRLHTAGPRAQPGALVGGCGGRSAPQAGWLLVLRSHRVRQPWPGRAASGRHGRPLVVGGPPGRGRGVLSHPCRRRWAFPLTVRLHLPGVPERPGRPQGCAAALPACRGLRTPADLHRLAMPVGRGWPAGACSPSASAPRPVDAVPALQGARSPLRPPGDAVDASSLWFVVCTPPTPLWTPAAIRVGGSP